MLTKRDFLQSVAIGALVLALPKTSAAAARGTPWQQQLLDLLNAERADANRRELLIYGEFSRLGPRLPLVWHQGVADAEQWWCDALQNTHGRWFGHFGYVNADGFLIEGPLPDGTFSTKQIGTMWQPSYVQEGRTDISDRLIHLKIANAGNSDNGTKLDTFSAERAAIAFRNGWNDDPRFATFHYANVIYPYWDTAGLAKGNWKGGRTTVFAGFIKAA